MVAVNEALYVRVEPSRNGNQAYIPTTGLYDGDLVIELPEIQMTTDQLIGKA